MAALAGLAYYLYQKRNLALSGRAQTIFDSFNTSQGLTERDLIYLAKEVESLQRQVMLQPRGTSSERFQLKIYPAFYIFSSKKYIVEIGRNNTWRVQLIEAPIGRGGFGKVIRLLDLHNGQRTALKIATPPKKDKYDQEYSIKACEDLKKEHRNLILMHTPPPIKPVGIQDKPLSNILTITKLYRSRSIHLAYEGTLYNGSLDRLNLRLLSIKLRLGIALQVLQGVEALLAKKLISHDLKPENILFRYQGQELPEVHVSDLGGVTLESELQQELKNGIAHTPAYADSTRLLVAQEIPLQFLQRHLVRNSEKCSLGLTVFSIITGQTATVESSLEEIWKSARLPLEGEYKKLFSALKNYSSTGFFSGLFKSNISGLRELVEKLYLNCGRA
jgi:serine/threonine protein kinase